MSGASLVVLGGTSGIGLELARRAAGQGRPVVLSGRDRAGAEEVAAGIDGDVTGLAVDLSEPATLADALADVGPVGGLVLAGIERDANTIDDYDLARATRLVTLKLVGYTEAVRVLRDRFEQVGGTGVVLVGGRAKDAPYPGSTTVSTINAGVEGLARTLALQLAPVRVNAVHPGIVGDSPFWAGKPAEVLQGYRDRTPGGALASMADVCGAIEFLLANEGVSGVNLAVDRGWRLT